MQNLKKIGVVFGEGHHVSQMVEPYLVCSDCLVGEGVWITEVTFCVLLWRKEIMAYVGGAGCCQTSPCPTEGVAVLE